MARILLVDDDDSLRIVMATVLERAGHAVTQAIDGRDALKIFRAEPADVVITDIVMPEQDGVGFMMALRTEFPGTPVIAMSGGATGTALYLEIARKLGARAVLQKPFRAVDLLATVDSATRPVG